MTTKAPQARMASLAAKLAPAPAPTAAEPAIAHAKHGEKSSYVKVTVTLPPSVYELIMAEVTRRKVAKEADPAISAVLRDAVLKHFTK